MNNAEMIKSALVSELVSEYELDDAISQIDKAKIEVIVTHENGVKNHYDIVNNPILKVRK